MRYDIEPVIAALKVISDLNKHEVMDLEFYYGGRKVDIPAEDIAEWPFVGLSTRDFVLNVVIPRVP
jgi:hypothetical protein